MQLSELWLYPVKSFRGHRVDSAELTRRGLAGDRRWMVVDEAGKFMTQRELPALARFHATLGPQAIGITHGTDSFQLPRTFEDGERTTVEVWRDPVEAVVHPEASRWVSERLGRRCRAVYMPDDVERQVDPGRARAGDVVSFADGFPLLLITQESLDLLNSRLPAPLPMERFRPNLVVRGAEPHAEDGWAHFRVGSVAMRGVKPCERCAMTTNDPATGLRGDEPLRTLATYRRRGNGVFFGMNVIHEATGRLTVGDPVSVP